MPEFSRPDGGLLGETIAGCYRIISTLSRGGMGETYRAWHEDLGLPVVIKVPQRRFLEDPTFAARFDLEIRLLRGLSHPHIVPILDAGWHGGLPFVVLRFLPGGSLSNRRLRDQQGRPCPNPPGMLALWLPAVATALDFVHDRGVVHRDVKPGNIFFDASWTAFLGDFGIAKIAAASDVFEQEQTLTATHLGMGTEGYMAPEQLTPKAPLDGRVDQYALAVTVYELLAGKRPFLGDTSNLIVEVLTQPPPSLAAVRPGLPRTLVAAVHRGLSKRPGDRFGSCQQFAAALLEDVQTIEDEPGVARLLCPKCANILKLSREAAGQRGRCPTCHTGMVVAEDLGSLWLLSEARLQGGGGGPPLPDGSVAKPAEQTSGEDHGVDDPAEVFSPLTQLRPAKRRRRQRQAATAPMILMTVVFLLAASSVILSIAVVASRPGRKARPPATRLEAVPKGFVDLAEGRPARDLRGVDGPDHHRSPEPGDDALHGSESGQGTEILPHLTRVETVPRGEAPIPAATKQTAVGQEPPPRPTLADLLGGARASSDTLHNSVGMELRLISGGTFWMGSESGGQAERPVRRVRITTAFYLGAHEVTNAQWKAVMGNVPSRWKDDDRPVEQIRWGDAVAFCRKLSGLREEREAGRVYRLPTEAEWEYACRASTSTTFSFGRDLKELEDHGWFRGNASATRPVGQKNPGPWGLFDMHGNVWEWCSDKAGPYPEGDSVDPAGPVTGSAHVARGGSWADRAEDCTSSSRGGGVVTFKNAQIGLRVALDPPTSDGER